jgi:hypothetical protein
MTINLARLKTQPNDQALQDRLNAAPELLDESIAESIRAASYKITLIPKREGCAALSLSIWDENGMYPLDHVTLTTYVGDPRGNLVGCQDSRRTSSVVAGLASLLEVGRYAKDNISEIDGALYIFETGNTVSSETKALYVDRFEATQSGRGRTGGFYTWDLQRTVDNLLAGGLADKIKKARGTAMSDAQNPFPYADAAEDLRRRIFPTDSAALRALSALQRTAARAKPDRPATILVRITSYGVPSGYLPLGLLSAASQSPTLVKPINVVQPLPNARYASKDTCVNAWDFGVSNALQFSDHPAVVEGIELPKEQWIRSRLSTLGQLRTFLDQTGAEGTAPADGFLLLAHHDSGAVWYEDPSENIIPEFINRKFPGGSVAVLAACSTAAMQSSQRMFADRLNQQGVDTVVMSPFPVPIDYAERLTREFVSILRSERRDDNGTSMLQLFQMANRETANYFRNSTTSTHADETGLEFIVAGDFASRLCTSRDNPRPPRAILPRGLGAQNWQDVYPRSMAKGATQTTAQDSRSMPPPTVLDVSEALARRRGDGSGHSGGNCPVPVPSGGAHARVQEITPH